MNVGVIFMLVALFLFIGCAIGWPPIPGIMAWGLASLTLGILLQGYPIPGMRSG